MQHDTRVNKNLCDVCPNGVCYSPHCPRAGGYNDEHYGAHVVSWRKWLAAVEWFKGRDWLLAETMRVLFQPARK